MSNKQNDIIAEEINEDREEGLPPLTLSQALDLVYDPMDSVISENMHSILEDLRDRNIYVE